MRCDAQNCANIIETWYFSAYTRGNSIAGCRMLSQGRPPQSQSGGRPGGTGLGYKETFWMACDSTEHIGAEYGPFHTRMEAEIEARHEGFEYLLASEPIAGKNEE